MAFFYFKYLYCTFKSLTFICLILKNMYHTLTYLNIQCLRTIPFAPLLEAAVQKLATELAFVLSMALSAGPYHLPHGLLHGLQALACQLTCMLHVSCQIFLGQQMGLWPSTTRLKLFTLLLSFLCTTWPYPLSLLLVIPSLIDLRKPPHPQLQQTAVDRVSKPWCLLTLPSKLWLLLAAILMPSLCPCPKSSMPTPATHPHTPLFLRIVFMTSYCMSPVWNYKPETDPSCQMCSCTWHQ